MQSAFPWPTPSQQNRLLSWGASQRLRRLAATPRNPLCKQRVALRQAPPSSRPPTTRSHPIILRHTLQTLSPASVARNWGDPGRGARRACIARPCPAKPQMGPRIWGCRPRAIDPCPGRRADRGCSPPRRPSAPSGAGSWHPQSRSPQSLFPEPGASRLQPGRLHRPLRRLALSSAGWPGSRSSLAPNVSQGPGEGSRSEQGFPAGKRAAGGCEAARKWPMTLQRLPGGQRP